MKITCYDGTIDGLFTVFYNAIFLHDTPEAIAREDKAEIGLFDERMRIPTDNEKSEALLSAIRKNMSQLFLANLLYGFLSEEDGVEKLLLNYLFLAWETSDNVSHFFSNPTALSVHKVSQRVRFEVHRLQGLIRFRKLKDGLLYAPISPDHNIVHLLGNHFKKRLASQRWMIHDVSRDIGIIYNGKRFELFAVENERMLETSDFAEEEMQIQALWKEYFRSIAIAERKNPRLQKNFMPKRYWKYLIEMS